MTKRTYGISASGAFTPTRPTDWPRNSTSRGRPTHDIITLQKLIERDYSIPAPQLEKEFARFLEAADDVERFAKLPERFGFVIEYLDPSGNLRFYEPDFVVVTMDGASYLVETKGMEDVNVASKDRAAQLWCENATLLTGKPWGYLKVQEKEYKQLQPSLFGEVSFLGLK
jgi:hypothetical protein